MEKKAYISPSILTYQMNIADGILTSVSGKDTLGQGDSTRKSSISEGDTKASGSWNVWSSDDE